MKSKFTLVLTCIGMLAGWIFFTGTPISAHESTPEDSGRPCIEHRGDCSMQEGCGAGGGCGSGMEMGQGRHGRGPGPHHGPPSGRGPGMGRHGMMHGGGAASGDAVCPQPRATAEAPESIRNTPNPVPATAEVIERGRLLFAGDAQPVCTACHGEAGDGRGMMGGGLQPPPRNFTCAETMQSLPDGQLFWIIQNGSPGTGMPAFSGGLTDTDVWSLVRYLRTLASKDNVSK